MFIGYYFVILLSEIKKQKRMKIHILKVAATAIGFAFLTGCQRAEDINSSNKLKEDQRENFIGQDVALSISQNIDPANFLAKEQEKDKTGAKVESMGANPVKEIIPIKDRDGNNVFYAVNYKNGGYIILSADNRTTPVLVNSEKGYFDMDKVANTGFIYYLEDLAEKIVTLRQEKAKQGDKEKFEWDRMVRPSMDYWNPCKDNPTSSACKKDPRSPHRRGLCKDTFYEKGPLLETAWGQSKGFNDYLPGKCEVRDRNGNIVTNLDGSPLIEQYPAGCAVIAAAQVMYYYKFPKKFNYELMNKKEATEETKKMIKYIYDNIGYSKSDCTGTSVHTSIKLGKFFQNNGFSSVYSLDYNEGRLKEEIRNDRPVILKGGSKKKVNPVLDILTMGYIPDYINGHVWVCDGYSESMMFDEDCENGWGTLMFHMNWGWGYEGEYNNWVSYADFSTVVNGEEKFNYKKGMVCVKP